MKRWLRYLAIGLGLAVGLLTITYLQFRFDQADLKNAVEAVRLTKPGGKADSTIEEKIQKKYKVAPDRISWVPRIESKFRGTVVVQAALPEGNPNLIYKVDLVRLAVIPITEEARELSRFP